MKGDGGRRMGVCDLPILVGGLSHQVTEMPPTFLLTASQGCCFKNRRIPEDIGGDGQTLERGRDREVCGLGHEGVLVSASIFRFRWK